MTGRPRADWHARAGRARGIAERFVFRCAGLACVTVSLGACGTGSAPAGGTASSGTAAMVDPASCAPVTGALAGTATLAAMAGEHRLTLVATDGEASGSATGGRLTLRPTAPGQRFLSDAATPLDGATDVDPRAVGGQRIGDPAGTDRAAPGVLVLESGEGSDRSILVRIGSDANRRDRVAFDQGFMVLTVRSLDDRGFAGSWRSGAGAATASGHFCVERAG